MYILYSKERTARTCQPGQDSKTETSRQNRTARTVQPEREIKKEAGRTGQAEQYRDW
jgi:hypothetical protein